MSLPAPRIAVITVHGIADQQPGQTVREVAWLLSQGHGGPPRYVEGELREVIVPVGRLSSMCEAASAPAAPDRSAPAPSPPARQDAAATPGQPSEFFLSQGAAGAHDAKALADDLGLTLTDYLLSRHRPAERDGLYESTRISLRRQADGAEVDLYEMYWADFSRLHPGGIRALSASYQLFFHLSTLARDVVDQVALAGRRSGSLALLQRLHAWSAWLLKGPVALLQLAMLLLVAFGVAAFVPVHQHRFLLGLGGGVAAVLLAVLALLAAQRAQGGVASRAAAIWPWASAAAACAAIAVLAATGFDALGGLYFGTAVLLSAALGVLLVLRYARTVRGVFLLGLAAVAAAVALLAHHAVRTMPRASTMVEWMLTAALNSGEALLAALLAAWAVLALVQIGAVLLGFALARGAKAEVAASLATARIVMVASTALFAMLSVVLWSVLAYVAGLGMKDLNFLPTIFGDGYRSAAIFFESQVKDVGSLFTPLLALAGVIGVVTLVALAPSLREELAPSDAVGADDAARLGRWWTAARRLLSLQFGTVVPLLAVAGGAVYLGFLLEKLGGVHGALEWLGSGGEVLVAIGKWLAGGALTITALVTRFTQTFGKLRVALDGVLDVDNYFRDPLDRRPPRARIFSRYAALLDYVRARGYSRLVIVAHSQGTVISADLLRYLRHSGRLGALTGGMPLALVTVGSPLRDLYGERFPLLYRWLGAPPASFADAAPGAAELGLTQWVNAYRAGDYVGRSIWTPASAAAMFRVATVDAGGGVVAERAGDRVEFCIGTGAHTHYFSQATTLALEIDRLIGGPLLPPQG